MLQFVGGSVVRRLVLLVGKRPSILVKDKVEPHTFLVRTEENKSMAVNIISLRPSLHSDTSAGRCSKTNSHV